MLNFIERIFTIPFELQVNVTDFNLFKDWLGESLLILNNVVKWTVLNVPETFQFKLGYQFNYDMNTRMLNFCRQLYAKYVNVYHHFIPNLDAFCYSEMRWNWENNFGIKEDTWSMQTQSFLEGNNTFQFLLRLNGQKKLLKKMWRQFWKMMRWLEIYINWHKTVLE